MNKKLEKYLRTRAIASSWRLEGNQRSGYKAAVVIPALAEDEALPKTLASLAENPPDDLDQSLVIVVVNNRKDASEEHKQQNRQTLDWLQSNPNPELNLAWIDASSSGLELPDKDGVGLARKLGFDLALTKLDWSAAPLFISLDADTLVDENYLPAIFRHFATSDKGGATLPFRHQDGENPNQEQAIRRYELYLRSYLFGLQQAGSPYAYHTIGSTFACRAAAYLAAGGMNRRLAAEDFYFLQQLAKSSGIEMMAGTVVHPSPRFSRRVPFGTGQAVQAQMEERTFPFKYISVGAFSILQAWFCLAQEKADEPASLLLQQAQTLEPVLRVFLDELNFSSVWQKLQHNHQRPQQRIAAFHAWFDALRTRQLLTRLDAEEVRSPEAIIRELLAWGGFAEVGGMRQQLLLLEKLQNV